MSQYFVKQFSVRRPVRSGTRFIVTSFFFLVFLVACAEPQTVEVTRLVEQEVEVTRVVEEEVTRVVEEEVTRVVEQLVETVVTATPEEMAQTEDLPADPTADRVEFPEGYQDEFTIFYEFDRPDNRTARVIYANEAAASVTADELVAASPVPGEPFPYGSVLVMEVYRTEQDEAGNVVLDENGRYVRGDLFGLFVMRKEAGFGAKYGEQRNGEWEYMAYRPDGSQLLPPEATFSCASCHVEAGQGQDWVFGTERAFGVEIPESSQDEVVVADYQFMPQTITVTVGTEVTWASHDVVFHTVTADDLFSSTLRPNANSSVTFEEAGTVDYFCAIHPRMTGRVVVVEE
jgi:plastocyanin